MPSELPSGFRPVGESEDSEWDMQVRSRDRATLVKLRKRMRAAGYGSSPVRATPDMDYQYRVYVRREDFAQLVANEVAAIDYVKFKPSTERRGGGGPALHSLYDQIWYVVAKFYGSRGPLDGWGDRRERQSA